MDGPSTRQRLRRSIGAWAAALGLDRVATSRYWEWRLAEDDARIDDLLAIPRAAAGLALAKLGASTASLPPGTRARWAPILALFEAWRDGESPISVRVPTVWLEFDEPLAAKPSTILPSVSCCLVGDYRPDRALGDGDLVRDLGVVHDALAHLAVEVAPRLRDALELAFAALPRGARWIHLSVMLGRRSRAIKLYGRFDRADLLPYLARVGWLGDSAAIEAALAGPYAPALIGDEVFVDLDLAGLQTAAGSSLGLAIGQQHLASDPDADPPRRRVLDRWIADGLCAPAKADAVGRWLAAAGDEDEAASRVPPEALRFVDLKLVWSRATAPDGALTAKAYLGSRCP